MSDACELCDAGQAALGGEVLLRYRLRITRIRAGKPAAEGVS